MRLRGIHIRDLDKCHKSLKSDISLDLMDNESHLLEQCLICGSNGSGKSLILDSIVACWSNSVLSSSRFREVPFLCTVRVDFDIGQELISLHIRSGVVERSVRLGQLSKFDLSSGSVVEGVVLYGINRLSLVESTLVGGDSLSLGVRSILPILHDLHARVIRDSIILVDNWDLGLDISFCAEFYKHLIRHAQSNNNQIILTSSTASPSYIPNRNVRALDNTLNPIQQALELIGNVKF